MAQMINGLFPGEIYPDETIGGCINIYENVWPDPEQTISLIENAAPESTLTILGWALLIGCIFILPFLFYLMFSFTKAKK